MLLWTASPLRPATTGIQRLRSRSLGSDCEDVVVVTTLSIPLSQREGLNILAVICLKVRNNTGYFGSYDDCAFPWHASTHGILGYQKGIGIMRDFLSTIGAIVLLTVVPAISILMLRDKLRRMRTKESDTERQQRRTVWHERMIRPEVEKVEELCGGKLPQTLIEMYSDH